MGATSGIGYEVALLLAQRGWKVGIAGRREEILSQMMKLQPGIVAYEVIDVTSPQATEGLQRLITKLGQMELYFHSSGIGFQNPSLDAEKELPTIETNCLGMARLVGEAFRYFASHPEREAELAVISSIARTKGLGAAPAYSASKRFTSHYLECLCQLKSIRQLTTYTSPTYDLASYVHRLSKIVASPCSWMQEMLLLTLYAPSNSTRQWSPSTGSTDCWSVAGN